jgi:hypothetical protein
VVKVLLIAAVATLLPHIAAAQARPVTPKRPFHRVQRTIDITGDGRPDTLSLEAFGAKSDSLDFILRIRAMGREVFRDEWNNSDQFTDYEPSRLNDHIKLARLVRRGMATFFATEAFAPITEPDKLAQWKPSGDMGCEGEMLDCLTFYLRFEKATAARVARGLPATPAAGPAYGEFLRAIDASPFDTALVKRVGSEWRTSKALTFTYAHGYETTRTVVWSSTLFRFIPTFECC